MVAQSVKNMSVIQEITCSAGYLGSISVLERSPGERNSNPLQFSCLEDPMDREAWQVTVHEVASVRHDLATKPPPPVGRGKEERQ